MDIGKRLKQLREKNNKTLKQVYKDTGISISNLSEVENGIHGCNAETLRILAKYYNVTTDYLLGKTDNPNSVIIKVADADGLTEVQHQLLDATKGLTADDLIEVNKYIEFIKSKKGN